VYSFSSIPNNQNGKKISSCIKLELCYTKAKYAARKKQWTDIAGKF
jgi:hypothetical protein